MQEGKAKQSINLNNSNKTEIA